MAGKHLCSPLIIDRDSKFLASVNADPESVLIPPKVAKTATEAERIITNRSHPLAAIFLNPKEGISLIPLAHQYRPATPLYIIYDKALPFTKREQSRLGINGAFEKPISYTQLTRSIEPAAFTYDVVYGSKQTSELSIPADTKEFICIPARDFLGGIPSTFDIFIKLDSGRFLKILRAKDVLPAHRVIGYINKGVDQFYIPRASYERCIQYSALVSKQILNLAEISYEMKAIHTLNAGEKVAGKIKLEGLTEETFTHVEDFLFDLHSLIKQMKPETKEIIEHFLSNLHAYEHAVGTTTIACLIAKYLRIQSFTAVRTVGMAALLHDISLTSFSETLQSENEAKMNEEEKRIYQNHPVQSANILRSFKQMDATAIQAVAQHHERRDGTGFPNRPHPDQIHRIAEIIGLSDELARLIHRRKQDSSIDVISELQNRIFKGFSITVVDAFKAVFSKKPPPENRV